MENKKEKKMIARIYDKANFATFFGLAFAIVGMQLCFRDMQDIAVICLIICGVCDAFDGMLARKLRKNADDNFGVELDSLVDTISSCIFPIILCSSLGYNSVINMIVYIIFAIAGVTRLAYYNIITSSGGKYFVGLPITTSTIFVPLTFLFLKNEIAFMTVLSILAVMYVSEIKVKKPGLRGKIILALIALAFIIYIIVKEIIKFNS